MTNSKSVGQYGGISIPSDALIPGSEMSEIYSAYLREIYEIHAAPSYEFPNAEIVLPKKGLNFALVPSDLELRDQDDGFEDEFVFDKFFESFKQECFFWNSFGLSDIKIIFVAPYSFSTRTWMMNARFKDNLGITSSSKSFSVISNIFFRYSIVSGESELVNRFYEAWGGKNKLNNIFVEYLDSLPRDENWEWSMKNLMPLLDRA